MPGLIMGFDYGTKRIGIAVGQQLTGTATALAVIKARDGIADWQALDALVKEWQPTTFIVGLPLNMDGTMSDMGEAAKKFARRLTGRYQLPHEMMDERLSTFEARSQSGEPYDPAAEVDAIAAKLILETWLKDHYSPESSNDNP